MTETTSTGTAGHECDDWHDGWCSVCCQMGAGICGGCELPEADQLGATITPALTPPGGIAAVRPVAAWIDPAAGVVAYVPGVGIRHERAGTFGLHVTEGQELTNVLDWLDDVSPGQASVILSRNFCREAGIGDRPKWFDPSASFLSGAVDHGWAWGQTDAWTTFYRGSRVVAVGIEPWIENRWPQGDGVAPVTAVVRLGDWYDLTRTVYRSTPGVTGTAMIRAHYDGQRKCPTWLPSAASAMRREFGNAELDWLPSLWRSPQSGHGYEHAYDARMMYLAAALVAELPWWSLKQHAGPNRPDGQTGYHLIDPGPWNLSECIPHPAGPRTVGGERRWVTTPTLRLLDELREQGVYPGYRLIESWTGDAGRILRPWAETLRDAIATAPRARDDATLPATLKAAYRETIGLLGREGGRVFRPEWRHIIIGTARSNLWRKVWRVGTETDRWPLRIDTDAVWYASPSPDPTWQAPLPLGPGLGKFSIKATHDMTRTEVPA